MNTQFRESFTKDLQAIRDKTLLKRVQGIIEVVEQASSLDEIAHLEKMTGWQRYFRIKLGDYRVGIAVDGDMVTFVRFLHRKDIYKYFP